MNELFKTKAGHESMPLEDERALIGLAQAGDAEAEWQLLYQYRGLLQTTAYSIRTKVRGMSPEQIEDLEGDITLAAIEGIRAFDSAKYIRLSQTLPTALRGAATEMATALAVPSGTLALWFKIWREADQDYPKATMLAPYRGMSANTFRAIQHALAYADSEWINVPYSAHTPTADIETHALANKALDLLTEPERAVIELAYGFRGDPKADDEVALILTSTKGTVKTQRQRSLKKMRAGLAKVPA